MPLIGRHIISWLPSPSPSTVGYKLYAGPSSGFYDEVIDVGFVTTYDYGVVSPGPRYFAVTAYDIHGAEGGFAPEFMMNFEYNENLRQWHRGMNTMGRQTSSGLIRCVLALLMLTFLLGSSPVHAVEPVCSQPTTLLCEDWESTTLPGRWIDGGGANIAIGSTPANVFAGTNAIQATFPSANAGWLGTFLTPSGNPGLSGTLGYDHVFARFYVKLGANWSCATSPPGTTWCGQLISFYGAQSGISGPYNPYSGNGQTGVVPNGTDYYEASLVMVKPTVNREMALYQYFPEQANQFGDTPVGAPTVQMPLDTWTCVETELLANTPGQHDGLQRLWVNDSLVVERTGMRWRDTLNLQTLQFQLTFSLTPPQTQQYFMDNLVVATQKIGCLATGAPAPPTGIVLDKYYLMATAAGTGAGTISSVPAGITCGADCNEPYDPNTTVTLTAVPTGNATFSGWSGDCSGLGACVVTMATTRMVTATFTAATVGSTPYFDDDFIDPNLTAWGGPDPNWPGNTFTTSSQAHSGTTSLQQHYPGGTVGGPILDRLIRDSANNVLQLDELWGRVWYRTHAFTYEATTGTKQWQLGNQAGGAGVGAPNFWVENVFGARNMDLIGQSVNDVNCPSSQPWPSTKVEDCIYHPNLITINLNDDQWYCIETHVKFNTPGVSDGIYQMWIDGQQTHNYTTQRFRPAVPTCIESSPGCTCGTPGSFCAFPTAKFDSIRIYRQAGNGDKYYDQFAVGPSRIGCNIPPPVTLTVAISGTGSGTVTSVPTGITCGADCTEAYTPNTSVTLTATPNGGSVFTGWTGACAGTSSPCVVAMAADENVTATFTTTVVGSSCTTDPNAFLCETWEAGTAPCSTSGWACNQNMIDHSTNVTPGLSGTNHTERITYLGYDGALLTDKSSSHTFNQGDKVYVKWSMKFSPNFTWAVQPDSPPGSFNQNVNAATDHLKTFEFQYTPAGNRMLLTTTANYTYDRSANACLSVPPSTNGRQPPTCVDTAAACNISNPSLCGTGTTGEPQWSVYPNSAFPGGTGVEIHRPNQPGGFVYNPSLGITYVNIVELTLRCGTGGRLRMWVNGTLVMDHTGIQTVSTCGTTDWSFIRPAGQYALPTSGSFIDIDEIQATTTDLTPVSTPPITLAWMDTNTSPNEAGTEIYVCPGDRCTPSSGSLIATKAPDVVTHTYNETSTGILGYAVRAAGTPGVVGSSNFSTPPVYMSLHNTTCPCTVWPASSIPINAANADPQAVEVGFRFQSDTSGYVTGIRFYKGPGNTGTHTGKLYTDTGTLLSSVVFTGESASGWQQMLFPSSVAITAGTAYVASYHTTSGNYAADVGYFASQFYGPPVRAIASGNGGNSGLYLYGAGGFPTNTFNATNYWVDVVFDYTAIVAPSNTIVVGPAELLYTDAQMPVTMDGTMATLKRDASSFFMWQSFSDIMTKWIGTFAQPFQTLVWTKNDNTPIWNHQGFTGIKWLYNIYEISPGGPLLGFVHVERGTVGTPGTGPHAVGLGYSTNGGDSWKYLGDIVYPQESYQNIGGVPYLIVGPYLYVYFNEFPLPHGTWKRMSMARALLADVLTAAASGTVVPFKKYNNGTWTQDGFTGVGSQLIAESNTDDFYNNHDDAAYSAALGQYLLLIDNYHLGTLTLYTSSDGVTWGNPTLIDQAPDPALQSAFATFVGLSGASNDMTTLGSDFYILFPRKDKRISYNYDDFYRRHITIVPATANLTVTLSGTGTGTVTSAPPGITCGADCTEPYAQNTVVTLTATPAAGSSFTGWSGDCAGTGLCVVTMAAARNVTASFTAAIAGTGQEAWCSANPAVCVCSRTFQAGAWVNTGPSGAQFWSQPVEPVTAKLCGALDGAGTPSVTLPSGGATPTQVSAGVSPNLSATEFTWTAVLSPQSTAGLAGRRVGVRYYSWTSANYASTSVEGIEDGHRISSTEVGPCTNDKYTQLGDYLTAYADHYSSSNNGAGFNGWTGINRRARWVMIEHYIQVYNQAPTVHEFYMTDLETGVSSSFTITSRLSDGQLAGVTDVIHRYRAGASDGGTCVGSLRVMYAAMASWPAGGSQRIPPATEVGVPVVSLTTDNQESICNRADIVLCDNWEARTVGTSTPTNTVFKGPSRPPYNDALPTVAGGWDNSGNAVTVVTAASQGLTAPDGSKVLNLHRAAVTTCPSPCPQAGTGYLDSYFPNCETHSAGCPSTVYVRYYIQWGPTHLFAGNANTKSVQMFVGGPTGTACAGGPGTCNDVHLGHSNAVTDGTLSPANELNLRQLVVSVQDGLPGTGCNFNGLVCQQNLNLPAVSVVNSRWYCLEFKLKMNSSASATDGTIDGWIDGVQKWSWAGQRLENTNRGTWGGLRITGSGFGGDQNYPAMDFWVDRLVVSTSRIGCQS